MNFQRPNLDTSTACRRDLLVSFGSSVALTAVFCGILGLVTLTVSGVLDMNESWSEPLTVEHAESEEKPEEPEEVVMAQPSPAMPVAPLAVISVVKPPRIQLRESPVPVVESPPIMDDLAWSEETFEPWVEAKKPVKRPVTRPVVAKKPSPAPRRKAVSKSSPKRVSVKAVPARVVSRSAPRYPSSARRSGKEGQVVVTVSVSASGKVLSAHVSSSSRNSALDSAALSAAKRFRFAPARNTSGQAVSSKVAVPFTFKLT